jgi:drug/metabolite transporter (DMT)-like permease
MSAAGRGRHRASRRWCFSSTLVFLAFTYLLRHESPARIGTYAYVNPLVAVLTGWLLLDDRLDGVQFAGTAVIYAGVVLVRSR